MTNQSFGSTTAYSKLYLGNANSATYTYTAYIGYSLTSVNTFGEISLTSEPSLTAVAAVSVASSLTTSANLRPSLIWTFTASHSGAALSSPFVANYIALVSTGGSSNAAVLALQPITQTLAVGSSLISTFKIEVESDV